MTKNPYYCNWCGELTNTLVKELESGILQWSGCSDCYIKKKKRDSHAKDK
jgi:hypothetical protein